MVRRYASLNDFALVGEAADEAIPERNVFQKIADFFKDLPFVEILLGLLVAASR